MRIVKKVVEVRDQARALELKEKLHILKNFRDPDNIFLDFSARRAGVFDKKFRFKIFYRNESRCDQTNQ